MLTDLVTAMAPAVGSSALLGDSGNWLIPRPGLYICWGLLAICFVLEIWCLFALCNLNRKPRNNEGENGQNNCKNDKDSGLLFRFCRNLVKRLNLTDWREKEGEPKT
jgi:hypothetical protein